MRIFIAILLAAVATAAASACPFCSAVSQTLSEEINTGDAAVIARLIGPSPKSTNPEKFEDQRLAVFQITEVLKGGKLLGSTQRIEVSYFGDREPGTQFLLIGADPRELAWGQANPLTDRGVKYVSQLVKLPATGPERLAFFVDYLEDEDPLLTGDSYDEFAKASYADVGGVKTKLNRERLIGWIKDRETPTNRRRLYFTLLSVCGQPSDLPALEAMIRDEDRQMRTALDALIGCYLTLKGADGLPMVEDLFLKNAKAEYTDTYAAIMALRFHGQETNVIPRPRLAAALRTMLARPQLADLVIPDLARWQDWTVMDALVKLFKEADDQSNWVRVPVINYLRACPLPEAKTHLEELAKIDPESMKRASSFFPLGSAVAPPAGAQRPEDSKKSPAAVPAAGEPKAPAETSPAPARPGKNNRAESHQRLPVDEPTASTTQVLGTAGAVGAGLLAVLVTLLHGGQPKV